MKMYFYRSSKMANFGDELNEWMWGRLLPDFFDGDASEIFLGIGSIIFNNFPASSRKIVFGAGYGGYTDAPAIDGNWKIYFVRGKLTARELGISDSYAVGDAAMLIRSCKVDRPLNTDRVSFMPHWQSISRGHWKEACDEAGIFYIDPSQSVDTVLEQIVSSKVILTEAMHGAIVSDALRVPWIPLRPIVGSHRMKWLDWASVLDLKLPEYKLPASSVCELLIGTFGDSSSIGKRIEDRKLFRDTAKSYFIDRAAAYLKQLASQSPCLSSDKAIEHAHSRMLEEIAKLKSTVA